MIEDLKQQFLLDGSLTLSVRVRPGARVTKIKKILADGSVKIDIAAAPEDGAANEELVRFLAEEFGLARASVTLVTGQTSRQKIIRLSC